MSYSQAWLDSSNSRRMVLVVLTAYNVLTVSEVTFYISTLGYITADGLTVFKPVIQNGPNYSESLSVEGNSISISYGDLEITNATLHWH